MEDLATTILFKISKTGAAPLEVACRLCKIDQKSGVFVISFLNGVGFWIHSANPLRMNEADFSSVG